MDNVIIGDLHIAGLVEVGYTNVDIDRIVHENENLHIGRDEILFNVEIENPFGPCENENPPIVENQGNFFIKIKKNVLDNLPSKISWR